MSHFITEQIRYLHEEIEIIEKAVADLIEEKIVQKKKRILYDYAINYLIEKIQNKSEFLLKLYEDKDELKKEEMHFLAGKTKTEGKDDIWKHYYERIKYIKDYHKKNNIKKTETKSTKAYKTEALKYNNLKTAFSPAEKNGKYIDMTPFYNEFINIKKIKEFRENLFIKKEMATNRKTNEENSTKKKTKKNETIQFRDIDLLTYLNNFTRFSYIPRYCKYKNEQYKLYLQHLKNYIISFFSKLNILMDCDKILNKYENMFEEKFQKKEIKKWEKYTYELDYYCKYNDKLFASEGTYNGYINSKKYKQDVQKYTDKQYTQEQEEELKKQIEQEDKQMAKSEFLIEAYANLLFKVIQKTIHRIQRKQSFTAEELQKKIKSGKKHKEKSLSVYDKYMLEDNETEQTELLSNQKYLSLSSDDDSSEYSEDIDSIDKKDKKKQEDDDDEEEEEENNKPIYNPLNLPLGYDNKPIPYWLYKLHGLSKEYKCEICGNHSYFGRVAFEKHFNEWRHSFGMKCLKIPNTRHFKEITKIEDALALYEKLKKQAQANMFKPEQEVECEDARGNVMDMKTYDDLKRQGII